jgi:pilus assembly protein Flp/PilA
MQALNRGGRREQPQSSQRILRSQVIPCGYGGYRAALGVPLLPGHQEGKLRTGAESAITPEEGQMKNFLGRLWSQEEGQDIAEYAVMLAVILVIVVGTVQLIGANSNNVFSNVASSIGG